MAQLHLSKLRHQCCTTITLMSCKQSVTPVSQGHRMALDPMAAT